ncbi:MAG: hypothetical protein COA96_10415 [SAR86 cluster bacterium]|uniref:Uncharacterized protein n=1 Tax=SAR86 cluster bacterium TaxID=2030880 RepID=A0A2A5AYE2_9GAMM|nr:MAG: hypothetical protein COA96_10415 [SAR86 cluster bacterium]
MPTLPFPAGFAGVENLPKSRESLTNCFNNQQGAIIPRPGIDEIAELDGIARGQFVWNKSLYQVFSTNLVTDTITGANTIIGAIAGNEIIDTAIGFNEAVIVVKGGEIYTLDKSNTLVSILGNPNIVSCDAVTHINGRFLYIPSDGSPSFFSDIGAAGTVQAASFFDAEELPDDNKTTFNLRNTLYIGGTDSFELFRDTPAFPVPFQRITGARLDYGFIGGLVAYADTFAFIGREKDQDHGIYLINQGRADKISNEAIDAILKTHTLESLSNAVATRFKWRSYDIMTFTLSTASFGYFGGQWFLLSKLIDGIESPWNGGFINQFEGEYYSASLKKVGRLSGSNTEYGELIPRILDIPFQHPDNEWFSVQSMGMAMSQGFNTGPATVGMALSRDNVNYGEFLFREMGAIGEYSKHLDWNYAGGLGSYDGFMGLRFYTTQNVEFDTNGLFAFFRS